MEITKKKIFEARTALAKLANTELPGPILDRLGPTLDAAEPVITAVLRAGEGADEERLLAGDAEVPACRIPSLPEIRMTYLERKALRGLVDFEEVT